MYRLLVKLLPGQAKTGKGRWFPSQRYIHPPGCIIAPVLLIGAVLLNACSPVSLPPLAVSTPAAEAAAGGPAAEQPALAVTSTAPYPERPRYGPGELVDYTAQTGDTLPGLAKRFNTTVQGILEANSFIPATATTMPPGMPMKIPIYYMPLWGSPYRILPDSLFVNGPAQLGFDTQAFVDSHPGWLKNYHGYVSDKDRTGAGIVDYVAHYYSVSPRLLLALLEYQSGALSQPQIPAGREEYLLGHEAWDRKGLFPQLAWAANQLNDGYYTYRIMQLDTLEHRDGTITRIDPWQNAATASLMRFFNNMYDYDQFLRATSPDGLAATYQALFGDPWANEQPHLPGSLEQPFFLLPFEPGDVWALTGGPHTGWGVGQPLAALDFAPPSKTQGCAYSDRWATAVADGIVVRSEEGQVMLDLDGDGDERTGWNVFYLHVGSDGRAQMGAVLNAGDPVGHPSCEGGSATGTHVHIARKYNGEWMPAGGIGGGFLAFNMEGWIAHNGPLAYEGTMKRNAQVIIAVTNANSRSFIQTDRRIPLK